MTDDAPDTLTRLLNNLPVGQPPLADLVSSGRAAKRRRSHIQVVAVACVVLVVMAGSFALSRTFGPTSGDSLVADGSTNKGLSATVEVGTDALTRSGLIGGDAVWDASDGTLLYASSGAFSSSCPPGNPTLTDLDGSLSLELDGPDVNAVCTADAAPIVVTITGLATAPEQLAVVVDGKPAETVTVTNRTVPDQVNLPTNTWRPGEPGNRALLTGTLVLDNNGCVALDQPPTGNRTYVTWPAGFVAVIPVNGGQFTLRDSDGNIVALSGDTVEMGGGFHPASAVEPHPCLPGGKTEIFSVQSEVTLVSRLGANDPALSNDIELACAAPQQTRVDLDIPGPGQPTPEEAVGPYLDGLAISNVQEEGQTATVTAVNDDGAAAIVYTLTKRKDGWWPDGYSEC